MQTVSSAEIFRYWQQIRGRSVVPLRSQVDPGQIRHILADLFILERHGRASPRFRLAGTRLCALFGKELRDTAFDSLWSATEMERLSGIACTVMTDRRPALFSASGTTVRGDRLDVELVLLPLKSGEGPVDRIIGSMAPLTKPVWLGAYPVPFLTPTDLAFPDPDAGFADVMPHRPPLRAAAPAQNGQPWSQAVRRALHLSVLDGGRGE